MTWRLAEAERGATVRSSLIYLGRIPSTLSRVPVGALSTPEILPPALQGPPVDLLGSHPRSV
jgi:hypothetical protein